MNKLYDIFDYFSPADSEEELWRKLHHFAKARYGVTSALYGFTHSMFTAERVGITQSLVLKHSHPDDYIRAVGSGTFLDNDICAAAIIADTAPFLWHEAQDWAPATEAQRQQAIIDRDFKMDVGVSFGFRFFEGQGTGGIGLCCRGMPAEEFARLWAAHGAEIQTMVSTFDVCMRQQMVANRFHLSPREREVLALSAGGLSAKEIAGYLGLSVKTVYNTLERARKSLQAGSTMEAVAKAYVYRLI